MKSVFSKSRRPKWVVPVLAGAGVVALVATAAIVWQSLPAEETPDPPIAAPSPTPVEIPANPGKYFAPATFDGWTVVSDGDEPAQFSVDGDSANEGSVSLRIDSGASIEGKAFAELTRSLEVAPDTDYTLTAAIQYSERGVGSSTASITAGADTPVTVDLLATDTSWTDVSLEYRTGPAETTLPLSIRPTGTNDGLRIDNLRIASAAPPVIVANGSFETFTSSTSMAGDSTLMVQAGSEGIDVEWFARAVDWVVTDQAGNSVANGFQEMLGGRAHVPVGSLPQGYYRLAVSASGAPAPALSANFGVVNPVKQGMALDNRFGVAAHVRAEIYSDSHEAALSTGIGNMRTDAYWSDVETVRGEYSFPPAYDISFAQYDSDGIAVLPIANGGNPLYDGGAFPHTAEAIQAFANYTAALVVHYDLPAVEIFNEYNNLRFNTEGCGAGPECYLPILKATHAAVKAVSPDTLIVGPANANQDDAWLTELYRLGGLDYLDVVSYHPYLATPEGLAADIQQAASRIAEYGNGVTKPIWLTEFGWTATGGVPSEYVQANYLVRAQILSLASGASKIYWYDLVNAQEDPADHEGNFGLYRRAAPNVPAFEPKPAGMVQAVLISKVTGKAPASQDPLGGGQYSYEFSSGEESLRVAWSTAGGSVSFASSEPLTVTTAMGTASVHEPVNGQVVLQLGEEPIYIEGSVSSVVVAG